MVLAGLIILIFGIGWAKGWHYGGSQLMLVASFPSASGLEKGDPVYVRGLKRGTVDRVSEADGRILVHIDLFEPVLIHKDASASIAMLELMGGKKIDIAPGDRGTFDPALDTLSGNANGDLSSLVSFVNSLTGTVERLAMRVDTVLGSINGIFGNGALKDKTYALLDQATRAIIDVRQTLDANKVSISRTLSDVDELAKQGTTALAEIKPGVVLTLDSVRHFISRSEVTINSADSLLKSISGILVEARQNKSVLYKLVVDKEFGLKFDSTLRNVNMLLDQLRNGGADVNIHLFR